MKVISYQRVLQIVASELLTKLACETDTILLTGVTKTFSVNHRASTEISRQLVLDNVDCVLRAGTMVGLVGATGAGKSTLGKIVAGILRPDSGRAEFGQINLFQCDCRQARLLRKWLRYSPQNPDAVLDPRISVAEAINEASNVSRLDTTDARLWLEALETSLLFESEWYQRRVSELSLGQRRKVINFRSLASCPQFIVLDEPFNGLDHASKLSMMAVLKYGCENRKMGVLVISHDVQTLKSECSEIWNIENGQLLPYLYSE